MIYAIAAAVLYLMLLDAGNDVKRREKRRRLLDMQPLEQRCLRSGSHIEIRNDDAYILIDSNQDIHMGSAKDVAAAQAKG